MIKDIDLLLESINLDVAKDLEAKTIKLAYLANLLAGIVLLKSGDTPSKRFISDITHRTLKSMSPSMSVINYWGTLVFNADSRASTKLLTSKQQTELIKVSGRIPWANVLPLHDALSTWNTNISWDVINESLRVITLRLPLRTPRINRIRDKFLKWASLDRNDKNSVITDILMFLLESDLHSPLTTRLKTLSSSTLIVLQKPNLSTNSMARMFEDDASPAEAQPAGTTSASIASVPTRLFSDKNIIKRVRRKWKMKPLTIK